MGQEILSRLQAVPAAAWVLIILAAVAGYGAGPVVRHIQRVPAEKKDTVIVLVKCAALLVLAVGILFAMGII